MGRDDGGKRFQELLWRTHGQNQGEGVEAREGGGIGWGGGSGRGKMQTTVIEQQ